MNAKKIIIYIIVIVLAWFIIIPIVQYVKLLRLINKFQSPISMNEDIFREKKRQSVYMPTEFNANSRLFYLCKVWGFLKYHYENDNGYNPPADELLLSAIPKVFHLDDKQSYVREIDSLISKFQITEPTGENPYPNIDDYALINNDWMNDTICINKGITIRLQNIFKHHIGKNSYYVFNKESTGNIRLMNEIKYNQSDLPNRDIRLLGLFRYWNIINYFYPSKNYMDDNWDRVLYESIPLFFNANTVKQYHLEIYKLINKLKDAHASLPYTIDYVTTGKYRPNFRMRLIDDTFVINKIRNIDFDDEKFHVGDIVLKVDNEDVHYLCDSLKQYIGGGNHWSEQRFLCNAILSRFDSVSLFTLLRNNDTIEVLSKNYEVYGLFQSERNKEKEREKEDLFKWVNDSIVYFDLTCATEKNFERNYNAIKSAAAIILDMRCYPSNELALRLTNTFVPANSFFAYSTYPDTRFPGLVRYLKSSSDKIGSDDYYKGRIFLLVNEWTESYSEYMAMAIQVNRNTVTIGNSSSGADGNYTLFDFPGNVKIIYTGIGIYYPDLTPTQRLGVKINYVVEPTLESIKNRKDLIYEKAVSLAKQ